jgi:MFS family permease
MADRGPAQPAAWLARNLIWLYAGRLLRSFSTSFLGVIFPLYLAQTGYSSAEVGMVLTFSSTVIAALVVAVGVAGDRVGRRLVLVSLGLIGAAGGGVLAVSPGPALVTVAGGLAGIGRGGGVGGGGGWGPFFPAEQPLLAASVPGERRTAAFGRIGFLGVLGGTAGSLAAAAPTWLHAVGWSWMGAYRLLFGCAAAISLIVAAVSLPLRDPRCVIRPGTRSDATIAGSARRSAAKLSTRQVVGRLALSNAINGFAIGCMGPILVYWFHRRYGVGPGEVGVAYAAANVGAALPQLGAARLAGRMGAVRAVVASRVLAAAFLLSMSWMPTFELAAAAFIVRSGLNAIGVPTRQSYVMGIAAEERRGTVAALGALPSQVTGSVSPVAVGALMRVLVDAPVWGGALFVAANAVAFWLSFRHAPPPEETAAVLPRQQQPHGSPGVEN